MKVLRVVLVVLGIACALCGLYGFYMVSQLLADSMFDMGIDELILLVRSASATAQLSFVHRATIFAMGNRMLLLVSGLISAVTGIAMIVVSKKR